MKHLKELTYGNIDRYGYIDIDMVTDTVKYRFSVCLHIHGVLT